MFKTIKSTELVYSAMIMHIVEEHKYNLLRSDTTLSLLETSLAFLDSVVFPHSAASVRPLTGHSKPDVRPTGGGFK